MCLDTLRTLINHKTMRVCVGIRAEGLNLAGMRKGLIDIRQLKYLGVHTAWVCWAYGVSRGDVFRLLYLNELGIFNREEFRGYNSVHGVYQTFGRFEGLDLVKRLSRRGFTDKQVRELPRYVLSVKSKKIVKDFEDLLNGDKVLTRSDLKKIDKSSSASKSLYAQVRALIEDQSGEVFDTATLDREREGYAREKKRQENTIVENKIDPADPGEELPF